MQQADLSHSISKVSVEKIMFGGARPWIMRLIFGGARPRIMRLIDHDTSGSVLFLATMHTELTAVRGKEVNRYNVYYSVNFSSPRTSPAFVASKREVVVRLSSESTVNKFLGLLKERIEKTGIGPCKAGSNIFFVATVEPPLGHNAFTSIIRFGFRRSGEVIKKHYVEVVHSAIPGRATPFEELEGKFFQELDSIDIAADLVAVREKAES